MWAPSSVSEAMLYAFLVSDVTVPSVFTPEDSVCPLSRSPKCA